MRKRENKSVWCCDQTHTIIKSKTEETKLSNQTSYSWCLFDVFMWEGDFIRRQLNKCRYAISCLCDNMQTNSFNVSRSLIFRSVCILVYKYRFYPWSINLTIIFFVKWILCVVQKMTDNGANHSLKTGIRVCPCCRINELNDKLVLHGQTINPANKCFGVVR